MQVIDEVLILLKQHTNFNILDDPSYFKVFCGLNRPMSLEVSRHTTEILLIVIKMNYVTTYVGKHNLTGGLAPMENITNCWVLGKATIRQSNISARLCNIFYAAEQ